MTTSHPTPPLPADALPGPLGRITTAVAAETQTPPDLAALAGLGTLSAATHGRWRVQIAPGWTETLALYTATLGNPGSRKSTVLHAVTKPLATREVELHEESKAARTRYQHAQAWVDQAIDAAARADAHAEDAIARATTAMQALAGLEKPRERWTHFGDIDHEHLLELLANQDGVGAQISGDHTLLETVLHETGQSRGRGLHTLCHAYDGGRIRIEGKPGGTTIDHPFLALILTAPPDILVNDHPEQAQRLLNRFLFAVPEFHIGTRDGRTSVAADEIHAEWDATVRALLDASFARDGVTTLELDPDAQAVLHRYRTELEPRLRPRHGDLAGITGWANKHPGRTARIAALLSLAEDPATELVAGSHMQNAVDLAEYFTAHARTALALAGPGTRQGRA